MVRSQDNFSSEDQKSTIAVVVADVVIVAVVAAFVFVFLVVVVYQAKIFFARMSFSLS